MEVKDKAYHKLLYDMMSACGYKNEAGTILIMTWEDQEHLDDWMARKPALNVVRCFKAPLTHFPMIETYNEKNLSALAVAIGKEKDFSDVKLVYYAYVSVKAK